MCFMYTLLLTAINEIDTVRESFGSSTQSSSKISYFYVTGGFIHIWEKKDFKPLSLRHKKLRKISLLKI